MFIGILICLIIISLVSYGIFKLVAPSERKKRKDKKIAMQILSEQLSHEEAICYACGSKGTKGSMKLYKIVTGEKDLGTHTENILGGLGGSKRVRTKQVFYNPGYICKSCEKNWEIACVIWIIVMIIGEILTHLFYRFVLPSNGDYYVWCLIIGTTISCLIARYCWKSYRVHKHCHVKILNQ